MAGLYETFTNFMYCMVMQGTHSLMQVDFIQMNNLSITISVKYLHGNVLRKLNKNLFKEGKM